MSPIFITIDEALIAHQRMIELFGGSMGVRDEKGEVVAFFKKQVRPA